MNAHPNLRAETPETIQNGKQVETRILVGCDQQAAAVERFKLFHRARGLCPEGQHSPCVIAQDFTGSGKGSVPGAALEKYFAQVTLKLTDHLANCRLRAVQSLGGARESLLFDNREKRFQLVNVHKFQLCTGQAFCTTISLVDDFKKNYKFDLWSKIHDNNRR